ncbi:PREDICTED: zinc finger protein 335 [Dufourea novaeangliae]|uniref:zinc finger protein 335 n=1 Tax=Dufourea novaeangliae TaxID=178035 RepID=UPI0007671232|nr:PREDICTED: zinc finger protein 335 [Dufourea novaeangliae]
MEGSGTGISRLDCYEDMFKEITRKLYGEDPDHRTSSVQNEFETSVSYKNDEDTGNGTDGSDDGNWTCEEEPLKGTDGSRIAAYHAGKSTWRCYECGEVMGGGPRDVAEHFMELHSSRILADDSRNRPHSPRKDYLQSDLKIEDVIPYLERLRERAERVAPPSRRTQETQTIPAALLPVTSTFLLQELPSSPAPQHLHQTTTTIPTSATVSVSVKRYTCPYCPYGTDRRDLYTRHENIHREEKPFHCYVCYKPFNRADHVKKHFLRMHREHGYELARIRRPVGSIAPKQEPGVGSTGNANTNGQQQQQQQQQQQPPQHTSYSSAFNNNKTYQLQPIPGNGTTTTTTIYQPTSMPVPSIMQPDATNCTTTGRRVQNGGCNSKSHLKGGSKGNQERRYSCCYCSWSGVDNWCLKRHLNTHLKPFACTLCEYKAARAERLATHVLKVHNRRQCSRCSFLGEDAAQLQMHQLHVHRISSANAPATSTVQATPQLNNRHPQPLHPVGGGRPPPGPPVFPAPAPAITSATTVIPPTTILGNQLVPDDPSAWESPDECAWECSWECPWIERKPYVRRSRKQSTPRKVIGNQEFEEEDMIFEQRYQEMFQEDLSRSAKKTIGLDELKMRYRRRLAGRKLLKCTLCPRESLARGRSYHTKASLVLHKFWRHGPRKTCLKSCVSRDRPLSLVSSITLRATVFTSPGYGYHR